LSQVNFRICPACSKRSLPVSNLLFGDAQCASCKNFSGVHWIASTSFAVAIFIVTAFTSLLVLTQSGLYAALIWLPFPIGALSFLKAWLCPLQARKPASKN
jgi:hypothetical protein